MNPILEEKIFASYPGIFRDRTKPMTQTCMCWGLECGDGWFHLLNLLCESLSYTYRTTVMIDDKIIGSLEPPQVVADQVKEKFGTLRFYYHLEPKEDMVKLEEQYPDHPAIREWYSDYMRYFDGVIHMAEIMSSHICEQTGKVGTMHATGGHPGGWLKVLNEEYAKTDPWCVERGYEPYKPSSDTPE